MTSSLPTHLLAFDRARKTREAHERLLAHYGEPTPDPAAHRPDPLPRLIRAIVAQNTSRANQEKALAKLAQRFPDPALIAEAPLAEVIDALHVAGLANQKAPRLQAMIAHLLEATDGTLDLSFLYDQPLDEARAFLLALPGVGPLTASLVLLFAMGRPVLPVNTGLHRLAQRVGMVPPNVSAERAQALLEAALPSEALYPFHLNMIRHARSTCAASRPKCAHCPLAPCCDWVHGGLIH